MITPKKRSFYAIASAGNPPSLDITNGKRWMGFMWGRLHLLT
jgi:fatty acyl-ACP thioesterase B